MPPAPSAASGVSCVTSLGARISHRGLPSRRDYRSRDCGPGAVPRCKPAFAQTSRRRRLTSQTHTTLFTAPGRQDLRECAVHGEYRRCHLGLPVELLVASRRQICTVGAHRGRSRRPARCTRRWQRKPVMPPTLRRRTWIGASRDRQGQPDHHLQRAGAGGQDPRRPTIHGERHCVLGSGRQLRLGYDCGEQSVSGGRRSLIGTGGTCTIRASQAGQHELHLAAASQVSSETDRCQGESDHHL